jgi:hypothetical protein
MSCKSRGKESEIESVQSHQETSDLIEKGIKYFSRTRAGKRPAIYFKMASFGTGSKKNLKVIYRQLEPLRLARTKTYHSGAWIATIIMPIVIGAVRKPGYILGSPPVFLDSSSLFPLLFSLPPLYQKGGEPVDTDPQKWENKGSLLFGLHKPSGTLIGNITIGFLLTGYCCPTLFFYKVASLPGV